MFFFAQKTEKVDDSGLSNELKEKGIKKKKNEEVNNLVQKQHEKEKNRRPRLVEVIKPTDNEEEELPLQDPETDPLDTGGGEEENNLDLQNTDNDHEYLVKIEKPEAEVMSFIYYLRPVYML